MDGNGGDAIRIEWNSIEMGEFVSNVVEILSELPKALSNPLKTLSEWGCVALEWPGLRAVVSAWCGHLHGSVLRHFMWVNWCVFRGRTTFFVIPN